MNLEEYMGKEKDDPNLFWRVSDGIHLNLLDESIEEIERLRNKIDIFEPVKA